MSALEVVKKMKESLSKPQTTGTLHEIEFTFHAPEAKRKYVSRESSITGVRRPCR